jgi:hypothetical protein
VPIESGIAWWINQETAMRQYRTLSRFVRPIAAVLLAVALHGCAHWSEVPEPRTLTASPRGTVRLTLVGEAKPRIVKHPTVVGDSLIWDRPTRASVPLSHVTFVEARAIDAVATGFFVLVGATFAVFKALH